MKIAIVTINNPSFNSATKLLKILDNHQCSIFNKTEDDGRLFFKFNKVDDILEKAWNEFDAIVFIMASGAVIRKIAPFLKDKATDPAVLIMTLDLKKIIPLLSGHLGGANELSNEISSKIENCINFVTTASDQIKVLAFDMFAKKYNYSISNLKSLAEISNAIINNKQVQVVTYPTIAQQVKNFDGYIEKNFIFIFPDNLKSLNTSLPTIYITPQKMANKNLQIHIDKIVLGLGMNRDTQKDEIQNAVDRFLLEHGLEFKQISKIASFEAKSDEIGLLEYAKEYNLTLEFFNETDINSLTQEFSPSQATKFFNIKGVAEPASLLASNYKTLFLNKRIYGNVTVGASF